LPALPRHSTDVFDGGSIDWNISGGAPTPSPGTVTVDVNDFDIYNCDNSAPVSGYNFISWNEWANLDFNLRTLISGAYDAESALNPVYPNTVADLSSLMFAQQTIQTSKMNGMNPPPSLLGDEHRNAKAALPLKFTLFKSDGITKITSGEGVGVVTRDDDPGVVCSLVTVGEIGPFLYDGTTQHAFTWQPTTTGQHYITIYMIVPGSDNPLTPEFDPQRVPQFDATTPSATHPLLFDSQGNRVTTKVFLDP
ncbi:MAG: hypothetical protein ACRD32_08425, partial [Nitrososphaerales archaeon]